MVPKAEGTGPGAVCPSQPVSYPPLNFFYTHFHNSIRTELESLAGWVVNLEQAEHKGEVLPPKLVELRERYRFLEQVYKYHSSVEDEVVYPALDSKVKNVTVAYRVEHQDEELLLEQLAHLINEAMTQAGADQRETLRVLICKVEEIHRTLKKHLAKEEEQLLPLLLQHFSFPEQAGLVAQFLYCIPLAMVEKVLAWLKPNIPETEQDQLLQHITGVVSDDLLVQLLTSWLQAQALTEDTTQDAALTAYANNLGPQHTVNTASGSPADQGTSHCAQCDREASNGRQGSKGSKAAGDVGPARDVHRPPIREVLHIHRTICYALVEFASEARQLQQRSDVTAQQMESLVERHRFLRSVCMFHTISEEEVMYPEVRRLSSSDPALAAPGGAGAGAAAACVACEHEHESEVSAMEELGRLLADVRAFARRGRKEVAQMLVRLTSSAEQVLSDITRHMNREETEVFPLLERHLCVHRQRSMVWRTLTAMPLRLLERVLPFVTASLDESDTAELLNNIRLGCPEPGSALVRLLVRWAGRGKAGVGTAEAGASGAVGQHDSQQKGDHAAPSGATKRDLNSLVHDYLAANNPSLLALVPGTFTHAHTDSHNTANGTEQPLQKRQRLENGKGGATVGTGSAFEVTAKAGGGFGQGETVDGRFVDGMLLVGQLGLAAEQQLSAASSAQLPGSASSSMVVTLADGMGNGTGLHAPAVTGPLVRAGSHECAQTDTAHQPGTAAPAAAPAAANNTTAAAAAAGAGRASPRPVAKAAPGTPTRNVFNPIDHIFQFHQALRQELRQLETDALNLEKAVMAHCNSDQDLGAAADAAGAVAAPAPGTAAWRQAHTPSPATPRSAAAPVGAGVGGGPAAAYMTRFPKRVVAAIQALDGRFQFLWGIYRAHSRSEDEIVFPALESKQALKNVSHAYTLDHQQEEQLFLDLEQIIDALKQCDGGVRAARETALAVRRLCAAVRATLETHVRSEESELWPLFTEHFTQDEQQYLVGVIIGRTGAQVLQTLLPWISGSFSVEEQELMLGSLRQVTKNTMFDQWLEAIQQTNSAGGAVTDEDVAGAAAAAHADGGAGAGGSVHGPSGRSGSGGWSGAAGTAAPPTLPDPELARYLVPPHASGAAGRAPNPAPPAQVPSHAPTPTQHETNGPEKAVHVDTQAAAGPQAAAASLASPAAAEPPCEHTAAGKAGGAAVESSTFRPGWEDIFRMNQKQLEAAVMRVSADPNLEPGRKAYLIQNIMVSKYIVAQQKRMQRELLLDEAGGADGAGAAAGLADAALAMGAPAAALARASAAATDAAGAVVPARSWRTYQDVGQGVLGCKHYKRKAQLVAPCCNRVFTCRLCHDEAVSHRMDRYAVSHMVCMECGTEQPVAGQCNTCATQLARYYCNICHLFDDEPNRPIYHCPFCNVCRRGRGLGIDFFHCMTCNACMNLSLFKSHVCREKAMESNCPVCSEYLFDSADPIKELPCGHLLHSRCFAEYTRYNYTCPLCSKSVGDMSVYFQMLDSLLASERLPPEYAGRMQQILCNDCGKTGFARFHFAYHACPHCRSYNTRLL